MRYSQAVAVGLLSVIGGSAVAQDASQWSGPYAGLQVSTNSGDMLYSDGGAFDLDGETLGLFLGYNYATGPWVFGAELAYSSGEVEEVGNPGFFLDPMTDIKARVGYGFDSLLVYGTVGATFTDWTESNSTFDGDGMLYGLGVDYKLGPRAFVGAEVLVRDIEAEWNSTGDTLDADLTTFSLRTGLSF